MKKLYTGLSLAIAIAVHSHAIAQERSINTSIRNGKDCQSLEISRNASREAYLAYAHCVIEESQSAFYGIFMRHLRDYPGDGHDVEVRFRVGTGGKVESADAYSPDVSEPSLLLKIAARLKLLTFLPPEDGARDVEYVFRFSQLNE